MIRQYKILVLKLLQLVPAMLKAEREELGLSQSQLAKKTGLSLRQIQRYEKNDCQGYEQASLKNVIAILDAMNDD